MRKRTLRTGFPDFHNKIRELFLKTSPKLAQSCSRGKYCIRGVALTHEVEKQPMAKVAQFRWETVDLATLRHTEVNTEDIK